MLMQAVNFVAMGLVALWTVVMSLTLVFFNWITPRVGHWVHHTWCRGNCWLMGVKYTFEGMENLPRGSAAVLSPNHESMFDIVVMGSMPYDFMWISKAEVGKVPFLGWALKAMGTYFVRRDKSGADLNVMKEVEDGLRSGMSVLIFPEGTRSRTGRLLPLKKGAFRTAQNAGVPVIPIGIRGTYAIAPPKQLPKSRGHHVLVKIGKPIPVPKGEDFQTVMGKYQNELEHLSGNTPA